MKLRTLMAAVALAASACGKGGGSGGGGASAGDLIPMTPALTPPPLAARGLVMGVSTEADLKAKLPGAKVSKDTSLGGDMTVQWNDAPAISIDADKVKAYLGGSPPVLMQLEVEADGVCDWVRDKILAKHPPTFCGPSNRKTEAKFLEACIATADGKHPIALNCDVDCLPVGGARTQCLTLTVH
jgi:hypothetical protein